MVTKRSHIFKQTCSWSLRKYVWHFCDHQALKVKLKNLVIIISLSRNILASCFVALISSPEKKAVKTIAKPDQLILLKGFFWALSTNFWENLLNLNPGWHYHLLPLAACSIKYAYLNYQYMNLLLKVLPSNPNVPKDYLWKQIMTEKR